MPSHAHLRQDGLPEALGLAVVLHLPHAPRQQPQPQAGQVEAAQDQAHGARGVGLVVRWEA